MLTVGFGLRHITPHIGAEIPGLFERRIATGIADDLFVRAVVLASGDRAVALVQVDAIAVPESVVRAAREQIAATTALPPEAVMIAATHTHSGGPVADLFSSNADPRYLASLSHAIAATVGIASKKCRPCLSGSATARAPGVAFNRRFHMKNGAQTTHPGKCNPKIDRVAGPADDTVTVIGFCDPKSMKPLGAVVNFACHATHMNGVAFSADYPRYVVDTLQAVHGPGFPVVFLNAPSGDVTQVDNLSARPHEFGPYWCARTGRAVGAAALQALATLDYSPAAGIDAATRHVNAALRTSTAAELARARKRAAKAAPEDCDAETLYAHERLAVEARRRETPRVPLEVQAVRIGDTLLWTVPGELFQAFALELRARSPFPHTCGVTLANGYQGYICTPEAYTGGGYEVRLARSSLLVPDTGARVVDAALRLARALHRRAARELRDLPRRAVWPTQTDSALEGIQALEKNRRQA